MVNIMRLLIGNSKYANWASLKSPVNDVNEIKKCFRKINITLKK